MGLIQTADGGDLFFDEIKDMVPQAQAGVLRVLEEGTVTPIGSQASDHVDVRFVSATNADIEAMSAAGTFRGDLLDRLRGGGTLVLPPLRDRKEDIPLLAERFVREAERANAKALPREINTGVCDKLLDYDWPGNIRELRQRVFQAVNNNPDVEHFVPIHIDVPQPGAARSTSVGEPADVSSPGPAVAKEPDPVVQRVARPPCGTVDDVISTLADCGFASFTSEDLVGRLGDLQEATARVLAKYLEAALIATRRVTPNDPQGEILIHPAVKLIENDSKTISASKAADIVKKLLNMSPKLRDSLPPDSPLKIAFEKAQRLRPSSSRARKKKTPEDV